MIKVHAYTTEFVRPDGTRFRVGVHFYDGAWRIVREEMGEA